MFSNIVVGTDGSDSASAAVAVALELARQWDATVHLVSAYRDPATTVAAYPAPMAISDTASSAEIAKSSCEGILADAAKSAQGIRVELHPICGPPADSIITVAKGADADLIVVGSKGMQGARRVLGSVPNRVAHRAPCNILIAKTA